MVSLVSIELGLDESDGLGLELLALLGPELCGGLAAHLDNGSDVITADDHFAGYWVGASRQQSVEVGGTGVWLYTLAAHAPWEVGAVIFLEEGIGHRVQFVSEIGVPLEVETTDRDPELGEEGPDVLVPEV